MDMEGEKKSNGAIIGVIIIVLILVIGGYWFWKQNRAELVGTDSASTAPDELGEITADEIIFEDEAGLDEFLLNEDLTTFDEVGGTIQ